MDGAHAVRILGRLLDVRTRLEKQREQAAAQRSAHARLCLQLPRDAGQRRVGKLALIKIERANRLVWRPASDRRERPSTTNTGSEN